MCQNNHIFIHIADWKMLERLHCVSALLNGMLYSVVVQERVTVT